MTEAGEERFFAGSFVYISIITKPYWSIQCSILLHGVKRYTSSYTRDVSLGATGVTAVAPKFSETLTLLHSGVRLFLLPWLGHIPVFNIDWTRGVDSFLNPGGWQ